MLSNFLIRFTQSKTATSTIWVTAEVGLSQLIRLGGNLVLTRLLAPEYFGLMAIIASVIGFFDMVSDIGLVPSITNSNRTTDPAFMRTAWSLQVIRSFILAGGLVIAAYPISIVYQEPILFPLLSFMALTVLMSGFNSTSLLLEQKHLRQKKLVLTRLSIQLISMACMIPLAFYLRDAWALVWGTLIASLCMLLLSYLLFQPHHSKFTLERDACREIIHFGKWIMVASLFGYFASRGGPLVMGMLLELDQLGVYMLAATFATLIEILANNLSAKILQPRYRQIINEGQGFAKLYRVRNLFNIMFLPGCIVISCLGEFIINTLYDSRYSEAGWILQILAAGRIGSILSNNSRPILTSLGKSKALMYNQAFAAACTLSLMIVGGKVAGFQGMVIANACSPFFHYFFVAAMLNKYGVSMVRRDALLIVASLAIIVLLWVVVDARAISIITSVIRQFNFSLF